MDSFEKFYIDSELSTEMNETNHSNKSTMRWKSISRPELGLSKITKSYAILCEDGNDAITETNAYKQISQ